MDQLLHLNRVSIASQIKDLFLEHLDIESIWNTNINGKLSDYKGLSIKHKNGDMTFLNMVVIFPYSKGINKSEGVQLHCPTSRRMAYQWVDGSIYQSEIFLYIVSRLL